MKQMRCKKYSNIKKGSVDLSKTQTASDQYSNYLEKDVNRLLFVSPLDGLIMANNFTSTWGIINRDKMP